MFNLPVNTYSIDPITYDKDEIISCIEKNYELDPSRNAVPNLGSLHQSLCDPNDKFKNPNYEQVSHLYAKSIEQYLADINLTGCQYRFYVANYTCISEHTNMRSHFHTESDFAAVHYIQFDDKVHSPTRFNNPCSWNEYAQFIRPNLYKFLSMDMEHSWFYDWWECIVKEDDIVFFPSMLKHEIPTQKKSDKNRITVSLNIELIS
tara:strand:- start:737 stop:1351 length:615 start_codon:yes stop_codon:yes gene_type:complete